MMRMSEMNDNCLNDKFKNQEKQFKKIEKELKELKTQMNIIDTRLTVMETNLNIANKMIYFVPIVISIITFICNYCDVAMHLT